MRGLLWTKWQWNSFLSQHFCCPLSMLFHQCYTIIFICILLLAEGQAGEVWTRTRLICLRFRASGGCCEHANELWDP
jgi:hypothetical protein